MTQSDTQTHSQTDSANTQTGSQTDSGLPESLSHTPSKHSRSSDHVQDEVTSPMRGTATAICVQSAPPLQWRQVIALGTFLKTGCHQSCQGESKLWSPNAAACRCCIMRSTALSHRRLATMEAGVWLQSICGSTCLHVTLLIVTPGASVASSW
ncbi:TPA: hypothetical protein ACH3X1_012860 [Trebouxia sp. C0004]